MSRTLFEEAIADAKQLREAAEQNAKNAIIEAVTPRIREFIENQLVGDEPETDDDFLQSALSETSEEEEEEEVELDESALKSLAALMGGKSSTVDANKAALAEAFSSLSDEEQAHLLGLLREGDAEEAKGEDVEKEKDGAYEVDLDELKAAIKTEVKPKAPLGDKKMKKMPADEELYELDEMMFEMDDEEEEESLAEAVLKLVGTAEEREAFDKIGLMGIDFEEEGEGEEAELGAEEAPPEGEEEMPAEEVPSEEEKGSEPVSERIYEIDENMLRHELARLREAKKGKKPKKVSSEKSHKIAADAFGGGVVEGDVLDVDMNKLVKEARENRALKQQLNDYRGAVETLREQLSDLNLFNAKLLYVNKILQNKDVAPNQRRSIIEALDGASNLREAKLLYQSLTSSITSKNESLNESVKHSAGGASRPVMSSSARISGAGEVDRWAILAGLK
jgi:hypothetical protein